MSSMLATIVPKSDQQNYDDFVGGVTKTIKVTGVKILAGDQPVAIHFEGDEGKPYKPGKSMRRVLVHVWGSDANAYVGKSMTLYGDPTVRFGGANVGGIRISHMSGITEPVTLALTATRAQRKPYTVQPLVTTDPMSPADKAINDAFDLLIQEAYGATTLEGVNEIAKKASKNKGVAKSKIEEMKAVITKKREEFAERQPGEDV